MSNKYIGKSVKRVEDKRFITGKGRYTDDIKLLGMTHASFVRSPYAHARVTSIDASAALEMPGVVAVFTGDDIKETGIVGVPTGWQVNFKNGDTMKEPPHPLLIATGSTAKHIGDPVAVVIAETYAQAVDAAEAVEVEWEDLETVTDPFKATQKGATLVHDDAPGNLAFDWELGSPLDEGNAAIDASAHVTTLEFVNQRMIPNAIEPRSYIGHYDEVSDKYTLYTSTQNPHLIRLLMCAFVLGLPEHKVRVLGPDVGGGFGSKIFHYTEEALVTWASQQTKRPIKWTETRSEAFMLDAHGRDHVTKAEMGFDGEGNIKALRIKTFANLGAYLSTFGPAVPTYLHGTLLQGLYTTPKIHIDLCGVFTHTVAVDAYRGAGRPEATYLLERLMDLSALEMGKDPIELRRQNFIPAFDGVEQPGYQTQVALQYDSGDYHGVVDKAMKMLDYEKFRKMQQEAAQNGKLLGVGFSTYIEACGIAPSAVVGSLGARAGLYESAQVRVQPTGKVSVFSGSHSHGQGHETTFAQIVADKFGIPMEDVDIVHSFGDVALTAYVPHVYPQGLEPGLDFASFYDPANFTYPFGCHIAVVEVDKDTGKVRLQRFIAVDDVGNVINPMIVDGQIHGGLAQGIGQALLEGAIYDDNGQLVNGSYMDYAMPRADNLPMFELDRQETPCPHNPLGAKGAGEAGTIGSTPAVVNAVIDALWSGGHKVKDIAMPLTGERVWRAMKGI